MENVCLQDLWFKVKYEKYPELSKSTQVLCYRPIKGVLWYSKVISKRLLFKKVTNLAKSQSLEGALFNISIGILKY